MKSFEHEGKGYLQSAEELSSRSYFLGAFASICISALFFVTGRRSIAYFIGLWAPTILIMGLFAKTLRPGKEM